MKNSTFVYNFDMKSGKKIIYHRSMIITQKLNCFSLNSNLISDQIYLRIIICINSIALTYLNEIKKIMKLTTLQYGHGTGL